MGIYRKKPVEIEAIQFNGLTVENTVSGEAEIFDEWIASRQGERKCRYVGQTMVIPTLEGDHTASPGDWIICGVAGELYPCKPDIFAETYDEVQS